MKTTAKLFVALLMIFALAACENKAASGDSHSHGEDGHAHGEDGHSHSHGEDAKAKPADTTAKAPTEELAKVEIAEAGAKLDPAIKPAQLPEGAWYCDMGTVHWAAMKKPEGGKCPECGMMLKQYNAAKVKDQEKKAVPADAHGHDHDHDGGDGHSHDHGEHGHKH